MNKNILLPVLLLVIQPVFTQAQVSKTDSLKKLLSNEKKDTSYILALTELSRSYGYSKPDTAFLLAQQAVALARQINFTKGEAMGLAIMGNVFNETGDYPKALELSLEALRKYELINYTEGMARVFRLIGNLYANQEDYHQSLNYTLKAKAISKSLHDEDEYNMWSNLLNLGDSYEKLNQLDSARFYTQQSYDLAMKIKETEGAGFALNNLGNIYSKMGQSTIALEFYRSGIPNLVQAGSIEALCESYLGMAKLFQKKGQTDSCLHYARLSMATAQKGRFTKNVLDASNFLTSFYKTIHEADSAFVYQSATIAAKDSLFSQEKSKQIQDLFFKETLRQQEIETAKLIAAEEHKHNLQYAAIAIGLIVFTGLFLLLSRSIIVNEKWIEFLGLLGLLIVFEFINLFIHPYLAEATQHSPVLMLLVLVAIAALLVPLHHKLEHWITHQMSAKNKRLRLSAAKRIVARLEGDPAGFLFFGHRLLCHSLQQLDRR